MQLKLYRTTFWDIDFDKLDADEHAAFIVERVFSEGKLTELKQILSYYQQSQIISFLKDAAFLDEKTLTFCSVLFGIDKSEFKCYLKRQSNQLHWNC